MKRAYLAAVAATAIASPALADKFFAVTPSGSAEMLFPDKPATVVGQLSSKCIDDHWTVTSSTTTELVCEAPMNFGQSLAGTLLMGNSYSTPPRRFFKFDAAEVNGISRVQASGWMELQMAFGQTRRTDFAGPEFQNSIFIFMGSAGGKYPPGTTFPNHVMLGIGVAEAPLPKGVGLRVTSIVQGSPAEKAGVQVGDVISSVAGKRFKNINSLLDADAKAAETPTYEVELTRNGQDMKLTLDRAFRSPFAEIVVAKADPAPAVAAPVVQQASTADELAKLAALKDRGIITADEFAAQKKKLLGN
jgi:hypothetical protein